MTLPQVTHMLLLGSDAPVMYQVAVALASGAILFYDLATYCVPGAAWHPDCCVVGAGHTGRVSTTLEVVFKCPPQHLLGAGWVPEASTACHSTHGSLPRPVNWQFSSGAGPAQPASSSSHDGCCSSSSCDSKDTCASGQGLELEGPVCAAVAQGWSNRPVQGGNVPLLLTGGRDGSLRAWDLRLQQLGHTWMVLHPHTGEGALWSGGTGRRCMLLAGLRLLRLYHGMNEHVDNNLWAHDAWSLP